MGCRAQVASKTCGRLAAAGAGNALMVALLLAHGATWTRVGHTRSSVRLTSDTSSSLTVVSSTGPGVSNTPPGVRRSPLHAAAGAGNAPMVALLLAHGARVAKKDEYGDMPYDIALRAKHTEVNLIS